MKLTFLGTSAANAFPEAFCRCANYQAARRQGRPSLRKRASLPVSLALLEVEAGQVTARLVML